MRVAAAIALLGMPVLASAHDLWVERAGDGLVVRYGHRGGELLPVDSAKVKTIRCGAATGSPVEVTRSASFSAKEVRFPGPCAIASVFTDGGYWSLTPDGEVNQPRNAVSQAVKAWASRQFAKWVDARSPASSSAVLGDELELVGVGDLSRARMGDKITVRVLSGGKPVSGAVVAIDHKPLGESDSAGDVRVKLRTTGIETLSATLRRKVATSEADALVLEASLSFEVAK